MSPINSSRLSVRRDRTARPAPWLLALVTALACGLGLVQAATGHAAMVAAADAQSCTIKSGGVWCWGSNGYGLGDGRSTESAIPVRVHGLSTAAGVAVGPEHACARLADRSVWCWGNNADGELGNGTTEEALTPIRVSGIGDAVAITVGDAHTCAVRASGQVACWGANGEGQLGNGTYDGSPVPVNVSGLADARGVTAGLEHTCAVLHGGAVRCWGSNRDDLLGDGSAVNRRPVPGGDLPGATDVIAVTAGPDVRHSCLLRAAGTVACWGDNWDGQLGDGTRVARAVPTPTLGLAGAVSVSVGSSFTCAVLRGGDSRCWGANDDGQLGQGTADERSITPIAVIGATAATDIASGANHTCISGAASTVQCWGHGPDGQLGNGKTSESADPTAVAGLPAATGLDVGIESACALHALGTISCWGRGRYGQVGAGPGHVRAPGPVAVAGITNATAITVGGVHACALRGIAGHPIAQTISCWGGNNNGRLGNGSTLDAHVPVSVDIAPVLSDPGTPANAGFAAVTAGNTFSCTLVATAGADYGNVWCWGMGSRGQLGNGDTAEHRTPTKVLRDMMPPPLFVASQHNGPTIASGNDHTCAISRVGTGDVWCWGSNYSGQLGRGATGLNQFRTRPQQVMGVTGVRSVAAGERHTCALRTIGTVACWGGGTSGQLGDGNASDSPVPVEVPITGVTALFASGNQTCATLADGSLSCWGGRFDGRFADRQNVADQGTPSPMAGVSGVAAVGVGNRHACAATAGGAVSCWGAGLNGELGDGPMPAGHYPAQRVPTYVIGFAPTPPTGVAPPTGPPPVQQHRPLPPVTAVAAPPARPRAPTIELRDGRISLRGLTVKRAKKAKTCPRTAKATITARVTVASGKRKAVRTVKATATLRLKKTKAACQTTATVRLKGQLAKAKRVTLAIAGKGVAPSKRTVRARFTATLQTTAVKLDRLVVRSTRKDVCPKRATVTVTGATKATKKQKASKKQVPVRLAPTANCQITTTVRLPTKLRKARAVTVTVQATGLRKTARTVRVG